MALPQMTQPGASSSTAWSASDLSANPHLAGDKAARVERMFACIAKRYDLNNRLHSFWRDQAWRKAAVRMAGAQPSDDVLDVACGTGDLTEAFRRAGVRSVTGLDFTQEMLDIAERKSARGMRRPLPLYVRGDAMSLPFADRSFDVVSIAFGIRNVERPEAALAEFHRVLRPGGRLVILEFSEPRNPLLRLLNRLYTCRLMPWTATLISGDRSGAYRYLPRSVATFLTPAMLAQAVDDSGFVEIVAAPLTFGVCTITRALKRSN
jgi:demethylmenaquinone methyltransferase / 2-methoxy-6-polyprenyl-1,4-benzoquinol methylase